MTAFVIRPASAGDIPGILAIWNPVIRDTTITFTSQEKTAVDVAQILADKAALGHGFVVADGPDGVAGFASYGQFRSGPGYGRAMEHSILLAAGAQGAGLGYRLLTATQDHASAGGAHCLMAAVSAENHAGLAFHARAGFAGVAVLPQVGWKFGRYIDLHLMQKFLP